MLHGVRDHARSWDWLARNFRDKWHVVCPDLRGHGDSEWSPDGAYLMPFLVADLAKLIEHLGEREVSIVAHSLGGSVALHYAGLYPDHVRRVAAIEGLGHSPPAIAEIERAPAATRWRYWIEDRRQLSSREPLRYPTLDAACARMREQNGFLSEEQLSHLARHGARRNEDATYCWKFDARANRVPPLSLSPDEVHALWRGIDCPVWLVHGMKSWAPHPAQGGEAGHFRNAKVTSYENAGHWPHHDRFESFATDLEAFL